jgi:hypothetical protein
MGLICTNYFEGRKFANCISLSGNLIVFDERASHFAR